MVKIGLRPWRPYLTRHRRDDSCNGGGNGRRLLIRPRPVDRLLQVSQSVSPALRAAFSAASSSRILRSISVVSSWATTWYCCIAITRFHTDRVDGRGHCGSDLLGICRFHRAVDRH